MPSGCKNKTCNGVTHAFVPFRFRLRSVQGSLRSPFSCFKCRLVVWDATAASMRTRMSRGKKIMKTATLIMKVSRAASSRVAPRPWLVSFEIIICAMEPLSPSSTFSCCFLLLAAASFLPTLSTLYHSPLFSRTCAGFNLQASASSSALGSPWYGTSSIKRWLSGGMGAGVGVSGSAVFCLNSIQFLASPGYTFAKRRL